ncbi:MAG TPA: hypothetical protein H9751_03170 [Candidatus Corynebacterium faecigallinarum]|uniref:Uncharacterized protein n=1 Tax=Candidatus Corynebacterium faecigallinarum TaxID=2838528 RepID=A0A9D2QBM9_9CORY|nr:hypothetical protein [Candidatus Corynebacterium faecigallinarum]
MSNEVMVITRWLRLATLIIATLILVGLGGTVAYICAGVCVLFLGVTVYQLLKLYRDERYRS